MLLRDQAMSTELLLVLSILFMKGVGFAVMQSNVWRMWSIIRVVELIEPVTQIVGTELQVVA
jgi:hypothetical protein